MSRLFICDPVCAQEFGHSVVALNYFTKTFASRFAEVIPICCNRLSARLVTKYGFQAFYSYYYEDYIPLPISSLLRQDHKIGDEISFDDSLETLATKDAISLLQHFSVSSADVVFFPSADFYGLLGLLNALALMPLNARPQLKLRFIGVMEHASKGFRDPERTLLRRLHEVCGSADNVSIGAETPALADRLASLLDTHVEVIAYPNLADVVPIPKVGPFYVFCPGSARHDKGYLSLLSVFTQVRERDPALSIRFVAQQLPPRDAVQFLSYTTKMYALPGVELLGHSISEDEMCLRYEQCSAVLLPYDEQTYKYRGSAAMMEAAYFGRPVITLDNTAFAEQVRYYKLGKICRDLGDMHGAIEDLARTPRIELQRNAAQSRFRFSSDIESTYDRWMGKAA